MRTLSIMMLLVGIFVGGLSTVRAGQAREQRPAPAADGSRSTESVDASKIVATYCAGCHNGVTRSPSGALLDQFDTTRIAENPDPWTRAYRQLEAGTMPPVAAARPDRRGYDAVLQMIEAALGANVPAAADATSQQIAERLALLLWNSAPDGPLLQDVQRNQLIRPDTLERQVRRMLGDDRARAFVERFFLPWLGLDQLGKKDPDRQYFPDFDDSLREAMTRETELFLLSQIREDRDPIELWTANYTFLNEQLARHYGVPNVTGARFGRATVPQERSGLLGQGSVLMVTSSHRHGLTAPYTSPAARAIWVRLHFLGAPAPRAFPNAQPVKPELPTTPQTRALPAEPCVHCHRNFFPLGYALENFDPIGRWRAQDQVGPVDASGAFVDGTPTDGVVALRNVLLQYPDAFRTTITEKLVLYASGKPVTASSMSPETLIRARQTLHSVRETRWSTIIAAIARH